MRRALIILCGLVTIWAAAALCFDFPVAWLRWPLALALLAFAVTVGRKRIVICLATVALVLAWWFSLKPRNDRNWQLDVARLPWAEVTGDRATIHNIRNCADVTETNYTP